MYFFNVICLLFLFGCLENEVIGILVCGKTHSSLFFCELGNTIRAALEREDIVNKLKASFPHEFKTATGFELQKSAYVLEAGIDPPTAKSNNAIAVITANYRRGDKTVDDFRFKVVAFTNLLGKPTIKGVYNIGFSTMKNANAALPQVVINLFTAQVVSKLPAEAGASSSAPPDTNDSASSSSGGDSGSSEDA